VCEGAAGRGFVEPRHLAIRVLEFTGNGIRAGFGERKMNLDGQSLVVLIVVGLIAGWLANKVVGGFGLGIIGSIVVGIIGAVIGTWLLGPGVLNVSVGAGLVAMIIKATIGAIVLLLAVAIVRRV